MEEDYGHWIYIGKFNSDDWFGFIYRIIDLDNGREYIGKKQFHRHITKKVKTKSGGQKNKRLVKGSDWKFYTSSSTHVNGAISAKGKENFCFLIESLHETKASLHYAEIEAQVDEDVLRTRFEDGTRKYYNGMIGHVKFIPPAETSDETKHKIRQTLRAFWLNTNHHYYNMMTCDERSEWDKKYRIGDNNRCKRGKTDDQIAELIKKMSGENNPMFAMTGENHPRFGKNPYNNLSKERYDEIKKTLSERNTGENNPRFGKSPHENMSEEQLETLKKNLSIKMSGKNNPMYGKPCTHKMTDEEKEQWKLNISKTTKGIPKSQSFKEKISMAKKGKQLPIIVCPHCGKDGGGPNMTRYHFDKCKYKTQ
jgi:hypothetical protein